MASGDSVVQVIEVMTPSSSYAQVDLRQGGSSPLEQVVVWDFDASNIEYLDFLCRLEKYAGGGLTFTLPWMASTATSNMVRWEIGIRALPDDSEDVDGSQTYDFNGVSDTCASASGELSYPTITFTDGADMDSWANGEMAIVRVRRKTDHTDDTMTGDAELLGVFGKET
jgi:hypothetical protein